MRTMASDSGAYPRAPAYRRLPAFDDAVREGPAPSGFAYTERHVKCVWYDDRLRPRDLRTANMEPVVVENPGRWNLEPGPDFLDALLLVGPERRRLAGDVEIHVHPADWRRHGHGRNPAYRRLAAHVTYFPGYLPDRVLPPGAEQIALQPCLDRDPGFTFESLDLSAYPSARLSAARCARKLADWDAVRLERLLAAAGEERLRRKTARMAGAIAARGRHQVFYEEFLCALGYKHNRRPFRMLAARLPLAALQETAGGRDMTACAVLAGVAGLLPEVMDGFDRETRVFIRHLWDEWWRHSARWEQARLPRDIWRLSGLRPQNHPFRRLSAAAALFSGRTDLPDLWESLSAANRPRRAMTLLAEAVRIPPGHYWRGHLGLWTGRCAKAGDLLGPGRLAAVLNNVIVPFQAACGSGYGPGFLDQLPGEGGNQIVRHTAHALLGPDHNPRLYGGGLKQQGLMQIGTDFCLEMRGDCVACRLPAALDEFH